MVTQRSNQSQTKSYKTKKTKSQSVTFTIAVIKKEKTLRIKKS